MSCFLLPSSFCGEIERIMARFWWQKADRKKGIHWCQWQQMCQPKEVGGMGFRSLAKFNVALLAKQGWRILTNPNSLVAQTLKAKYFPNESFLNSRLGNNCSYTWKSIWAAKEVLSDDMCWKVGNGSAISALDDSWIPDFKNARLSSYVNNLCDFKVAELIDESISTFPTDVAVKILHILLAKEAHDDILAWSAGPSGEFTVRSAYKLLHDSETDPSAYALQTNYRNFYKKFWNVRGLGRSLTVKRLKNKLRAINPRILFLLETKLSSKKIELVRLKCGFENGIDIGGIGSRGGLSLG
ncbi:RNA-directed DNA polymerase reverse transcriptase family protein [Gossypium australe]|uniref:RNA-directed DNA polymerase reverse transcriptase family protein n=1 Tax=Gossypium australe TaxID=47621 RepID=A0A5B6X7N1_9ROSI|nr:RNA-directed DNA polymerase reverse transcriptase family protein [Gossypium australe]